MLNKETITLLTSNVLSFQKHYLEILSEISDNGIPEICCFSEIWKPAPTLLNIPGYHSPIVKLRTLKRGGGVGIFIKSDISIEKIYSLESLEQKHIESIATTISKNFKFYTIICIYRPPNSNITAALTEIEQLINYFHNHAHTLIFNGDLNIDLKQDNRVTKSYINLIESFGLKQLVQTPTRMSSTIQTLIDHVITNHPDDLKTQVLDSAIMDHQTIITKITNPKQHPSKSELQKTKKRLNFKETVESIESLNWTKIYEETENLGASETLAHVTKIIQENFVYSNKNFHKKTIKLQPWYTDEATIKKRQKIKALKLFRENMTVELETKYKKLRKEYNQLLDKLKKSYYHEQIKKADGNGQKIWKLINSSMNRKSKKDHAEAQEISLMNDGILEKNKFKVAEIFNNYFINVAPQISFSIPDTELTVKDLLKNTKRPKETFKYEEMSTFSMELLISWLKPKKSCGIDFISAKLIKALKQELSPILKSVFNKSIKEKQFPKCIKTSLLTPIFKADDKHQASNYRPIQQNSSLSKVLEIASNQQENFFLREHSIISNKQFGFRKAHSTTHPLMLTKDYIEKYTNQNKIVMLICLDLRKAFDLVQSNSILPKLLEHYNFHQDAIEYYTSFFSDRSQIVTIDGTYSNIEKLHNISVVQGSTKGPGTFSLYINHLVDYINMYTVLFADDTNFLISHENINELEKIANKELKRVDEFMTTMKLAINKEKTVYTIFNPTKIRHKKHNIEVKIGDSKLQYVEEVKFLGLHIDNKLSMNTHFEHIVKKIKSGIAALNYVKKYLPTKTKLLIYHGLIQSHLDYVSIIWLTSLNKGKMKQLLTLQKRAIRLVFNKHYICHTADLFRKAKVTRIDFQILKSSLEFIYLKSKDLLPEEISKIITNFDHQICTRQNSSMKFNIPPEYKKGDLVYTILDNWNNIPIEMKKTIIDGRKGTSNISTIIMKRKIKEYIFDQYEKCYLKNCYSCDALTRRPDFKKPPTNQNQPTLNIVTTPIMNNINLQHNIRTAFNNNLPQLLNPLLNPLLNHQTSNHKG